MTTMVDRIAQVLRERFKDVPTQTTRHNLPPWRDLREEFKELWRAEARKLLAAMIEPDDNMLEAGRAAIPLDTASDNDADHVWGAMIREAGR
jgi:hypothetical protein